MTFQPIAATIRPTKPSLRPLLASGAALVLLAAMALDTRVVAIGASGSVQPGAFSPAAYGQSEFPKVRDGVETRAVAAPVLAQALAKDPAAAAKQYGVGSEFCVSFSGVVGQGDSGDYDVAVEGLPTPVKVRLQTGPAIMGTDLRDATGTISFGQFTNQIEYQNAGSALNKEMKKQVLAKVDPANLSGKAVSVVGVFQMTDPANWLVTPVKLEVR